MNNSKNHFRIFLCGDVMTGRGIDQILPQPSQPQLYESFVTDARGYVHLAEQVNGKINYPVKMDYIWGDALPIWHHMQPDIKIINLETAITTSEDCWPAKGIHYRMHPLNVNVLHSAGIDICTLANNHILDWGYEGLKETLKTLQQSKIECSGAGENSKQAMQPAVFALGNNKRALVFAAGTASSGVPAGWRATSERAGVYYLPEISSADIEIVAENINQYRRADDLIIFSLHWGSNWGYAIPEWFRFFAHGLIDDAKVDVVFGHSSHHPRPIEMYRGKPIFYGCGDFINDYEGISGYEEFRDDLTFMYFLDFDRSSLAFQKMTLVPLQIKNFRLHRASPEDCEWMLKTLNQCATFGAQFKLEDSSLILSP